MTHAKRTLVELKARASNLKALRAKLNALGASLVGVYHQKDTYFQVPSGRLKLREVEGRPPLLIYYEREDVPTPKRSNVYLLEVGEPLLREAILEVLKPLVVVEKKREIYVYEGTQIHLDEVEGLGSFIEFEREVEGTPEAVEEGRKSLRQLMERLGIPRENLESLSYSDLMLGVG